MPEIGAYDSTLRLEETVVPSPNSIDLSRSILNDYNNRFSNTTPNAAEIFHLNSTISRYGALDVPADRVGAFWRFMKFYGPRGYRMVLMGCGELLRELELNLTATRHENVYDNELEDCLMLDGVERSFLAALSLETDS